MKAACWALLALALHACARAHIIDEEPIPLICTRPIDDGEACAGEEPSTRYAYKMKIRQCISFHHKGCGGTSNNFDTMAECRRTCERNYRVESLPVADS